MTPPDGTVSRHPWWTIDGAELLRVLRLAHAGADPDMLYAEMYANAHVTPPAGQPGPAEVA